VFYPVEQLHLIVLPLLDQDVDGSVARFGREGIGFSVQISPHFIKIPSKAPCQYQAPVGRIKKFLLITRSGSALLMVFLGLTYMFMTVPNLVFLFVCLPPISFDFCSSYQLLIKFSAHS
jgi:hypothetical protein